MRRLVLLVATFGLLFYTAHLRAAQANPVIVGSARFTVITPTCIRLEYGTGGFVDEASLFAVNRSAHDDSFRLQQSGSATIIDTGQMTLTYSPDGKAFSPENLRVTVRKGEGSTIWLPGSENPGNLGGTVQSLDGASGPVDLHQGLLSRDGWYLLDDSRSPLFTSDWMKERPSTAGTDWYLFGYGSDYHAALRSLSVIGGSVPLPRRYALGVWYSRYWPYTSAEYRKIVQEYRLHDFPLDVMVMDTDWHGPEWTGWSWNRKLLPDATDLLASFHADGLHTSLNLHPQGGVAPREDRYLPFMRALGADPASGKTVLLDVESKPYMNALFSKIFDPLEKDGVDFWWLDWSESGNRVNTLLYDRTARGGMRGLSFSRWAGWGDHRHPIHFTGDTNTGFPMLAFEVPFTTTGGNVGCFFMTHDIGGFQGGRNEESYVRWAQFGATSAVLRSHSTRDASTDRRPWNYPAWAETSLRNSFHLRSELFPYIYSSAWQSSRDTVPLDRAMYFDNPTDEAAYHNAQEYMLGDHILAAPIVTPGIGKNKLGQQTVWFPPGTWYNHFTGERYDGETEQLVAADINEFPLYVRGGVPVPMQPYQSRMGTSPLKTLRVRTYPGEDGRQGTFLLYEDDGTSTGYTRGEFASTSLHYLRQGDLVTVTVDKAAGHYNGQLAARDLVIELPDTARAKKATLGNRRVPVTYDAVSFTNRIVLPARAVNETTIVTVQAVPLGWAQQREAAQRRRSAGLSAERGVTLSETQKLQNTEAALAVLGIAVVRKDDSTYHYKASLHNEFLAPPGVLDGNQARTDDGTILPIPPAGSSVVLPDTTGPASAPSAGKTDHVNFAIKGVQYRLPILPVDVYKP